MTEILISFIAGLAFCVGAMFPLAVIWAVVWVLVNGFPKGEG